MLLCIFVTSFSDLFTGHVSYNKTVTGCSGQHTFFHYIIRPSSR